MIPVIVAAMLANPLVTASESTTKQHFLHTAQLIPLELKEKDLIVDYKPLIEVIKTALDILKSPSQNYAQIIENKIIINTEFVYSEISRNTTSWGVLIKILNQEKTVKQELPFNTDPLIDTELAKYLPLPKSK